MTYVILDYKKVPYSEECLSGKETFPDIAAVDHFWVDVVWFFERGSGL